MFFILLWFLTIRAFSCRTSSVSCSKSPSTNAVFTKFQFFVDIVGSVTVFRPNGVIEMSVQNGNNNAISRVSVCLLLK